MSLLHARLPAPSSLARIARWPWTGVALAAAVLCLAALPPAWLRGLALEAWPVSRTEPWRLWTAQAVHWGWAHAGVNALALALTAGLAQHLFGRGRVLGVLAVSAPALSLGILLLEPGLGPYRGASGCVVLLACMAWAGLWRGRRAAPVWLLVIAAAFVCKLALEWHGSAAGSGLPVGVRLAWSAHACGALLGLAWGAGLPLRPWTPDVATATASATATRC